MIRQRGEQLEATNGYMVIFKPDHHLAMRNGYVYVHRMVMEEKLGRRLEDGEDVHHKDENRKNNAPDNLELKPHDQHASDHNRKRSELRILGAPNPLVQCDCGCGNTFPKFDSENRPRKFISGHNRNSANSKGKPFHGKRNRH